MEFSNFYKEGANSIPIGKKESLEMAQRERGGVEHWRRGRRGRSVERTRGHVDFRRQRSDKLLEVLEVEMNIGFWKRHW